MRHLLTVLVLVLSSVAVGADEAFPDRDFEKIGELIHPHCAGGFAVSEVTGGSIYLFGGGVCEPWSTNVRKYDVASNSWSVLPVALPYPWLNNERYGVARATNGKFYLTPGNGPGGWGSNHQIIEVDVVAGTAIQRASIMGSSIWGVAVSAAPQGGVYMFGGWNGGGIASIRYYDPVSDTSVHKAFLSVGRTIGARVTHPNGRVYLFGGNTGGTVQAVDVFDMTTEVARPVPNPSGFAFNHGTQGWVDADGSILLWNPNAGELGFASDRIIRFDPVTETFTDAGDSPMPGGTPHSAVVNPPSNSVYFFGLALPGYVWGVSGVLVPEVWRLAASCTFAPPPWQVVRSTGAPVVSTLEFSSCGGAGTLTIANAGVASAIVVLNGETIATPSSFNRNRAMLTFPVTLLAGNNVLSVELRSKPGSSLTISFEH